MRVVPVFALSLAFVLLLPVQSVAQPIPIDGNDRAIKNDFQIDLERSLGQAERLRADLDRNGLTPTAIPNLISLFDQVRAEALLIGEDLKRAEERLRDKAVSASILDRQARMSAAFGEEMDRIEREMDEIVRSTGGADGNVDRARLRAAIEVLIRDLAERVRSVDRTPIGVNLPYRSLNLPQVSSQLGAAIVPAYLDENLPTPTPADLREGPDVALSGEIIDQARTLHRNPIEIFEFVQNQVEMEFYHGAMKGALETLTQKRGNDVDQASLLVALMRASGVPARYVRGVIALSASQSLDWTGLSTSRRVAELLTASGVPFQTIRQGGAIRSFELEHTWAEIYVTYNNYRGAPLEAVGQAWIPLDPSFKSLASAQGVDLRAAMNFKADALVAEYLSGPQELSPVDFYKKKITDYLAANRPDLTFEQLLSQRTPQPVSVGLLPSTLPYPTISVNQEGATLPEPLRHRVRLVAQGEGATSFDVTLPVSELLNRRLTLSYVPAEVEDQIAVDAFLGLENAPAYLIKLRPVLKLAGVTVKAGESPIQMGATHTFTIEIQSPRGTLPISNPVVAGGYYAIGLGSERVTPRLPDVRAPEDTEGPAADLLYKLAADYLERWNEAERAIADILGVANVRPALSEVMIGLVFNVTSLFGQPQAMEWRGVSVDADLRLSDPVPIGADDGLRREFMRVSGLAGSMLEGEVLQQNLQVDAVSGGRLIQLARAAGMPIDEIDAANASTLLPLLQTAGIVKTEIADAVNQGWRATVPRSDFARNIWNGIGYVLLDDATGAAGYFISGSLAGASTTPSPQTWVQQFLSLLGHLYSGPPNRDPNAAVSIRKVTNTDNQPGTVGKLLDRPLAVWVRDAAGKPVEGATVTFTILAGDGTFVAGRAVTSVTATSDSFGVATAIPLLGEKTSIRPAYVEVKPTDTYLTQVGVNTITAAVRGIAGDIPLDVPFEAFAQPGDPVKIVKVLGDDTVATAGATAGTVQVRVVDRYNNPISNLKIDFTVLDATPELGGPLPATARNLVLYPLQPPCANQTPILGECGGRGQLPAETSIFGAFAATILGDTVATQFRISAALIGNSQVSSVTFSLYSSGNRRYGTERYHAPTLEMTALQLVNENKDVVNGTKVGTLFQRPLEVVLYVVEDNYLLVPLAGSCDQATQDCFRIKSLETSRTRAIDIHKPGSPIPFAGQRPDEVSAEKARETAHVTFSVTEGGGTTDPQEPQHSLDEGRYVSFLTVGPQPALNKVEVVATAEVWKPDFKLHAGTVELTNPVPMSVAYTLAHEVFGIRVSATPRTLYVAKTADPQVPFVTAADFDLQYRIEPASYRGWSIEIDLIEIDGLLRTENFLDALIGQPVFGSGAAKLLFGKALDATKKHVMQAVLNRGSQAEVRSEKVDLTLKPVVVEIQNQSGPFGRDSTDFMAPGYSRAQGSIVDADPDQPAKIFYNVDAPDVALANAVLKINGGAVRAIPLPAADGEADISWDGKDSAGRFVAGGASYGVTLEVSTADGGIVFRSAPHLIHVVEVVRVELFNAQDGALGKNEHPVKPGGGMIFADRPTPNDPVDDKVKVKVTLSARVPAGELEVFLKSYDVQDPTGLIHANHSIAGMFGSDGVPAEGTLSAPAVDPDGKDLIEVEFTVTRQPGDNFKIAASTNRRLIADLGQHHIIQSIDDTGATTLPILQPLTSERLTVWRRLHVEVDSMGRVSGNVLTGTIVAPAQDNGNGTSWVKTDLSLTGLNASRFDPELLSSGARSSAGLRDAAGNFFQVKGTVSGANAKVLVNNNLGSVRPIQGPFSLVDDDDMNGDDGANPDGDRICLPIVGLCVGEDVPEPDTSMMQDTLDGAHNVFAYAYVVPKYDLGSASNGDVPFVLNTPDGNPEPALIGTYRFDTIDHEADETFWTVYLLGAYQYQANQDGDPAQFETDWAVGGPNTERPPVFGVADALKGKGASIFMEMTRGLEWKDPFWTVAQANPFTVVHEIGHLFGGDHCDYGLMWGAHCRETSAANALKFSDQTLRRIRGIDHP